MRIQRSEGYVDGLRTHKSCDNEGQDKVTNEMFENE